MNNKFMKNILSGFLGQIFILVLGVVVPRVMIVNYGSDVNGVLGTITQIFTYMALLEAGIGQATKNALYKHVSNNNQDEISVVVSISRRYFRRITIIYGISVVLISVIAPLILKSELDKFTIFMIVFWEGMSGVISFFFIETDIVLLNADGKSYINNSISTINRIIGYGVKIILAYLGINVAFLQMVYFFITIAKVFFYRKYVAQNYPWLKYDLASSKDKLPDRNAFVLTEIAWTIFSSTDMIILSMFLSTESASVYSVYNIVFANLNTLLSTVFHSVSYLLGETYHKSIREYEKIHDAFNTFFMTSMTILMSVSYILILPFVELYTKGVVDTEYIHNQLPIAFCLIQMISWSRYVPGALSGIAGYAKQTSYISMLEALINVIMSMLLVHNFGIVGVLIATVVALPIKVVYLLWLSDYRIMKRSCKQSLRILLSNYLIFFGCVLIREYIDVYVSNYFEFAIIGVITTVIVSFFCCLFNYFANPQSIKYLKIFKG